MLRAIPTQCSCFLQGDITRLREVYDGFLAEYPLCYGYWKKYADAEHRSGSPELAVSVFERGTAAIPYSVDLWGHMCTFKISQNAAADEVRRYTLSPYPVLAGDSGTPYVPPLCTPCPSWTCGLLSPS